MKRKGSLLQQIRDEELSISELSTTCKKYKKMTEIQISFMRYLDLQSWEAATSRYPEHTRRERLEPFLEVCFKKDTLLPSFIAFCQQAKQHQLAQQSSQQHDRDGSDTVMVGDVLASVFKFDSLHVETNDILSCLQQPGLCFTGINLTVLDPPEVNAKVWQCTIAST